MWDWIGQMFGGLAMGAWSAFGARQRALLIAGAVVCIWATHAVATVGGVPVEPGFSGSLLTGPGVVGKLSVAVAVLVIGLVVDLTLARSMGVEGAVFCAGIGLAALAVRCGPIRPVLVYDGGRAVLGRLSIEALLLGGAMVGGWYALDRLVRSARAKVDGVVAPLTISTEVADATLQQKLSTTGFTMLVMAIVQLVLVQTDTASQCLASVAVAAFLATLAGYSYLPLASGVWYWVAPTLLGAVGYGLALASGDVSATGEFTGWFAPLARPTPLHYASLGTALAVLAHWSSRRWALAEEPVEQQTSTDAPATA